MSERERIYPDGQEVNRRVRWIVRPGLLLIYRTGLDRTPRRLRAEAWLWQLAGLHDVAGAMRWAAHQREARCRAHQEGGR